LLTRGVKCAPADAHTRAYAPRQIRPPPDTHAKSKSKGKPNVKAGILGKQ
jgi:hypothetical protein